VVQAMAGTADLTAVNVTALGKSRRRPTGRRGNDSVANRSEKRFVGFPRDGKLFNSTGMPPIVKVKLGNAEFRVVQTVESLAYATASNAVATFTTLTFSVGALDQITPLTALFDQYRIELVEVWLTPRMTAANGIALNFGQFHSVIDFDDNNSLTTVPQALDYENCVFGAGCVGHYRRWVPHIAMAAYSGAFTSFANVTSPWIDAASSAVQHYGLKTAWTVCDGAYIYDIQYRLHTVWRNVR